MIAIARAAPAKMRVLNTLFLLLLRGAYRRADGSQWLQLGWRRTGDSRAAIIIAPTRSAASPLRRSASSAAGPCTAGSAASLETSPPPLLASRAALSLAFQNIKRGRTTCVLRRGYHARPWACLWLGPHPRKN